MVLADLLFYAAVGFGGLFVFIVFVLPALPIIWWNCVKLVANVLQTALAFVIVMPILIAVLLAAGMIVGM